jgi:hypothetical protein
MKSERCETVTVVVVLCGCETWSVTLREESRLRVLRKISWPKKEEIAGNWTKLYNEQFCNFYCSPTIIRRMK